MWRHSALEQDWVDMLPDPKQLLEGQSAGFDELWEDVRRTAKDRLQCQNIVPWRGYELALEFAVAVSPQIDWIYVKPVPDPAKEINYEGQLGAHVLRLRFRRRDNQAWPEFRSEVVFDSNWQARLRLHRVDSGQQLEILIGVHKWNDCHDSAERRGAINDAFLAAVKVVAAETRLEFRGLTEARTQGGTG